MSTWTDLDDAQRDRHVGLLLALIVNAGGRGDPRRFARRPEGSPSREAFGECVRRGYVDAEGWLTAVGRERHALADDVATMTDREARTLAYDGAAGTALGELRSSGAILPALVEAIDEPGFGDYLQVQRGWSPDDVARFAGYVQERVVAGRTGPLADPPANAGSEAPDVR